ncbi:MAG TPA: hypothetical protein ENH82_02695 [bacterium]|nr:hypothetical protein [bacterium]
MKELRGYITIARTMGSLEETPIWIDIKDKNSGVLACRTKITLEQYANALTGRAEIPCSMEFNDSGLVGKVRLYKKVTVPHSGNSLYGDKNAVKKHIEDSCPDVIADGWEPYLDDFTNMHRHTENGMKVQFQKYVDADSEEAIAKADGEVE